ncbi:MAG TPA: S8 family peptidase, partial [Solirubrobacteraceae bacterium]|nr:S8 family peptidase [Solirubrobacteraceae bacterium]
MRLRPLLAVLALIAAVTAGVALFPQPATAPPVEHAQLAGPGGPAPAPRDVIVRFERGAEPAERAAVRRAADVELRRTLPVDGMQLVRPAPGRTARAAADELEDAPGVLYAEPDHVRRALATPDDQFFPLLWGLHNTGQRVAGTTGTTDVDIDAPEAWDRTTGAAGIVVAVADTGLDAAHPDLAPNLWRNPDELVNGRDDDGNGLVDDVHGWDFAGRDADPADVDGHGTHVAGTIGARGNDRTGVAGVAWRTSLLPLRVLGDDGNGSVSALIGGYAYARQKGVRLLNASLGGSAFSRAERDAIAAARDTLFIAAAGNDGADNDAAPTYPCAYDLPNVICVAAIDANGALATFSNRGARTVDLAAPGVNTASTYPGGRWVFLDGTSMATPHVSGVAALAWAAAPAATVADVRRALLDTTVPLPTLVGQTVTGGLVNARAAIDAIAPTAAAAPEQESAPEQPAPEQPAPDQPARD